MIEMLIDTIRVSLISQQRIIMLREVDGEQQLPIWIGPCEAEAIESRLRDTELARPMTHDLLKLLVEELGATLQKIEISELRDAAVFHAVLYLDVKGETREIDCRPSDAMALAVRWDVPIYVADSVMEEAGIVPEPDILEDDEDGFDLGDEGEVPPEDGDDDPETSADLDAFKDFFDSLDD